VLGVRVLRFVRCAALGHSLLHHVSLHLVSSTYKDELFAFHIHLLGAVARPQPGACMGMAGRIIRPPWPVPACRGGKRAPDDRLDLLKRHRNAASHLLTKVAMERIVFHWSSEA